ncbi:MAG: iron-containing alcohol dehydrogenase [bacterium]
MESFEYYFPTRIVCGPGCVRKVAEEIKKAEVSKPLLVTDPGIIRAGLVAETAERLKEEGIKFTLFQDVEANPSASVVEEGFDIFQKDGCDSLLALGGGSSIDTAKAIGILKNNGRKIMDYEGVGKVEKRIPWMIAIPTTYGSGSEVTSFAVITDRVRKFKAAIGSSLIVPDLALIDPELMVALPYQIAASVGLDALCHAVESYCSKIATPFSEMLALQAIRLISKNIRRAVESDSDVEATFNMAMSSTMAGMAFSLSRLGLVHAMSHPLGGIYGVPHGVANALLLPYVMEYNAQAVPDKYAAIAEIMGIEVKSISNTEAAARAVQRVASLRDSFGVPAKLSSLGVRKEDISQMAADTMKSGNVKVNPRDTNLEDIIAIYQKAF